MQMTEALGRGVHAFMPTALHAVYVRIYRLYAAGHPALRRVPCPIGAGTYRPGLRFGNRSGRLIGAELTGSSVGAVSANYS